MGTAAQLAAETRHVHHAHLVAVFVAEERDGPGGHGLLAIHHGLAHLPVLQDDSVDAVLHLPDLGSGHGLHVVEVEAQPIRPHVGARLSRVRAQHLLERRVQQVRRRMVPHGPGAQFCVHLRRQRSAGPHRAALHLHVMHHQARDGRHSVQHPGLDRSVRTAQRAHVADLSTGLGVEGRPVQDHLALRPFAAQFLDLRAGLQQRQHPCVLHDQRVVTLEVGGHPTRQIAVELLGCGVRPALPGRLRALLLPGHLALKARHGDAQPGLVCCGHDLIHGQSQRVVERKHLLTRNLRQARVARTPDQIAQRRVAALQRVAEALLLHATYLHHVVALLADLRVGTAHLLHHRGDESEQERRLLSQEMGVRGSAAQHTPHHVATIAAGRCDAVTDEERDGTQVIGDDLEGDVHLGVLAERTACRLPHGL